MASKIISKLTTAACGLLTVGVLVALPMSARAEEGKCSAGKGVPAAEAHCSADKKGDHEGKCAAGAKHAEGKCGEAKKGEGKCGEGKGHEAATAKTGGKCGEGKCGEGKKK